MKWTMFAIGVFLMMLGSSIQLQARLAGDGDVPPEDISSYKEAWETKQDGNNQKTLLGLRVPSKVTMRGKMVFDGSGNAASDEFFVVGGNAISTEKSPEKSRSYCVVKMKSKLSGKFVLESGQQLEVKKTKTEGKLTKLEVDSSGPIKSISCGVGVSECAASRYVGQCSWTDSDEPAKVGHLRSAFGWGVTLDEPPSKLVDSAVNVPKEAEGQAPKNVKSSLIDAVKNTGSSAGKNLKN